MLCICNQLFWPYAETLKPVDLDNRLFMKLSSELISFVM